MVLLEGLSGINDIINGLSGVNGITRGVIRD